MLGGAGGSPCRAPWKRHVRPLHLHVSVIRIKLLLYSGREAGDDIFI